MLPFLLRSAGGRKALATLCVGICAVVAGALVVVMILQSSRTPEVLTQGVSNTREEKLAILAELNREAASSSEEARLQILGTIASSSEVQGDNYEKLKVLNDVREYYASPIHTRRAYCGHAFGGRGLSVLPG